MTLQKSDWEKLLKQSEDNVKEHTKMLDINEEMIKLAKCRIKSAETAKKD